MTLPHEPDNDGPLRIVGVILLIAFIIALVALFSGCKGPGWARRALPKVDAKHPAIVDEYCGRTRPVKESETVRETLTPGQTVTVHDTVTQRVEVDCPPAAKGSVVYRDVRVACPPSTHRVDTFTREREVVRENTAARRAAEALRDEAKADAIKLKSQRNTARWAAGGMLGLILIWLLITRVIPRFR